MNEYDDIIKSAGTTDSYDAMVKADADQGRQKLRASMVAAERGPSPDEYGKAKQLERKTGVPAPIAARNMPEVKLKADLNEYDQLLQTSPVLARVLSSPDFASISRDDIDTLREVERLMKRAPRFSPEQIETQREVDRLLKRAPAPEYGFTDYLPGALERGWLKFKQTPSLMNLHAYRNVTSQLDDMDRRLAAGERIAPIDDPHHYRLRTPEQRAQFRARMASSASGSIANVVELEREKAQIPQDPIVAEAMQAKSFADFWHAFEQKPLEFIALVGAESLPQSASGLLAAIPAGMVAGPSGVVAAVGGNSLVTDYTNSLLEALREEKVDVKDQAALQAALADRALMERVARKAFAHASVVAGFDAASGGLAGKMLVPRALAGAKTRAAVNLAAQAPVQGTLGAAGEAGGTLAAGGELKAGSIMAEFFGEFATAPVDVAVAAAGKMHDTYRAAQAAEQNARALEQLNQLAQAAKTLARDPESFEAFVDQAAADGPVQGVFIDARKFAQAAGDALPEIVAASPSVAAQLETAIASGGDIVIPIGEYATRIGPTEANKALKPHWRIGADAMSMEEAKTFMREHVEQFKADAEKMLAQHEFNDAIKESGKVVEQEILAQLEQRANRFTSDVNRTYAKFAAAFFTVNSQRLQVPITPEEFYIRYALQIQAEGVREGRGVMDQAPMGYKRVTASEASDPDYVYHATNSERADEIAAGALGLARPGDFTDQETWPDGSTKKRNYFTPTAKNTWQFAPEEGAPALLRVKKGAHPFQAENGTGDLFSAKPIPAASIEYLSEDGSWRPLSERVANAKDSGYTQAQGDANELDLDFTGASIQPQELHATVGGGRAAQGWAGATRIRGEDGRPTPVYRGAAHALRPEHFDLGALGHATGRPSSGLGVWFTISGEEAASYGSVETFNIDMRNPLVVKVDELPGFDTVEEAHAWREEQRAAGYDGLLITAKHLGGRVHLVAFTPESVVLPQGTFEQGPKKHSSDKTRSRNFKKWSGGAPIIKPDEFGQYEGGPAVFEVYHGTTGDFERFDKQRANPESDLGAGFYFTNTPEDVSINYAGEGPDLTNRIELKAERIFAERDDFDDLKYGTPEYKAAMDEARREAKTQLAVEHGGMVMPVFVKMSNPAIIGGDAGTRLEQEYVYDDPDDPESGIVDVAGTLPDFLNALEQVASRYEDGSTDGVREAFEGEDYYITLEEALKRVKADEKFSYYTDDRGELVSTEIVRLALERMGFDGIVDYTVDEKFGTGSKYKQMEGMTPDTVHVIAFEPQQIKSAIGNRGTFDASDNILNQETIDNDTGKPDARPPFYSVLERQIEAAKMKVAPAAQWKSFINGLSSKGVKKEEIEWSGVNEWLDVQATEKWVVEFPDGVVQPVASQADGATYLKSAEERGVHPKGGEVKKLPDRVERDAVTAFLRANGVKVTERILGGASTFEASFGEWQDDTPDFKEEAEQYLDEAREELSEDLEEGEELDEADVQERAEEFAERAFYDDPSRPQYREIEVEANGKSYRFIENARFGDRDLFAPSNQGNELDAAGGESIPVRSGRHGPDDAQIEAAIRSYLGEKLRIDFDEEGAPFEDYTLPGGENYQVMLLKLPGGTFQSSHFNDEGILAHVRTKERVDAEGKRVLFIEEFQSDWAQKGKKEGFAETKPQFRIFSEEHGAGGKPFDTEAEAQAAIPAFAKANEVDPSTLSVQQSTYTSDGVPTAPFVQKTEAWLALAMKRMVRYAAENGFDRVAWTTGEQQADRYDLSKQIDKVVLVKGRDGGIQLRALKDGGMKISQFVGDDAQANLYSEVEHYIGKEPAAKLEAMEWGSVQPNGVSEKVLENVDLKIGGEGMIAFYDKIVVNVANDVLKKLGGGRVGGIYIPVINRKTATGTNAGLREVSFEEAKQAHAQGSTILYGSAGQTGTNYQEVRAGNTDFVMSILDKPEHTFWVRDEQPAGQPGFDITPKMRETAMQGLPLFQPSKKQGGSRGQISFGDDIKSRPSILTLLQNADLSTFLHEMGHFQLEVLADIASQPDAPAEIAADMQKLLAWFKPGMSLDDWRAMPLEEKRPYHEQYARGFEAYLFEGKSPAPELNGIFSRFRAWLLNVYKQLTSLNVTLTDDVRGVMDRMLATNEQIQTAEAARNYEPLFKSAEEAGMTPAEWKAYHELGLNATQEAVDQLQTRGLRDMQWLQNARGRELKRLQKNAESKRKAVEAEVRDEVRSDPVYAVQRFLRYGELPDADRSNAERRLLDSIAGQPTKLSLPALKEMYGEEPAAPWRYLSVGAGGLAATDGIHPDIAAELFGFTSGDHLVKAILEAQPESAVIEGMTDQRMLERYGDLSSPEALERAANEAIHNEARVRFVSTELRLLARATGQKNVLIKAAREFAATIVARKKLRDIKPAQHAAAEARAAKAAEKAMMAKKLPEAAVEKRNQLVNGFATKAAYDALEEIEKGVRYLKRIGDSKTVDPEYREQIEALLARFDLRRITAKDAERRKSLVEWIAAEREEGNEPVIAAELENEANRKPYQDMTLEEFRGLVDAVKNIEHLGRLKHKLLTARDEREFNAVKDDLVAATHENATGVVPERRVSERSPLVVMARLFRQAVGVHRKFANFARGFDGWKDGGVWWERLVRPMNAAGDFEATRGHRFNEEFSAIISPILGKGRMAERQLVPGTNKSFTREERIGMLLNMGNETNVERVLSGEHLSPAQLRQIVGTLSREDAEFVNRAWALIDSFWPEVAAKERRITGLDPEKVKAEPFVLELADGSMVRMRGGYYPIIYDPDRSERSNADINAEVQKQLERGFYARSTTRRGHTKARTDSTGRPLRYDFANVIAQHAEQVIHDLAWHEYLIDANRLLRNEEIANAVKDHYGVEALRNMKNALRDIAIGNMGVETGAKFFNYLRSGVTISTMGWNMWNALQNITGLTQSVPRIGGKWVLKGAAHWFGDTARFENSVAEIHEKSEFMRNRPRTMNREINDIRNKIEGRLSKWEASYFYLQKVTQYMVDVPTWWGAYEKAMAENDMTEERAIALADQAVRDAQGAGQVADQSAIMRGPAGLKLITTFGGFFNTTLNNTIEVAGRTRKASDLPGAVVDMMMLWSVPALLSTLILAALKDEWDDEEKLLRKIAADQITFLMGMVIGLREAGAAVQGLLGAGTGSYSGPASMRLFSEMAKLGKQAAQGEADEAFWRALFGVVGTALHLPTNQPVNTVDGIIAITTGKTENPGALLVGSNKR